MLKLQKNKKTKPIKNQAKNSNENSPIIPHDETNMINITNEIEVIEIDESKLKQEEKYKNPSFFNRKPTNKNKDLSLSDLILDSSFLSPGTASKLKFEEFVAKNSKKEAEEKNSMILIEENSDNWENSNNEKFEKEEENQEKEEENEKKEDENKENEEQKFEKEK